jgi:hypothetical protein
MKRFRARYDENSEPKPTETHPYEFAADRTLGLFTYHVKKIGLIIGILILIGIIFLMLYLSWV